MAAMYQVRALEGGGLGGEVVEEFTTERAARKAFWARYAMYTNAPTAMDVELELVQVHEQATIKGHTTEE